MDKLEPIKLLDGTELIPLEAEEKEKLEAELGAILDKYNASYLPAIREEKTLSKISQVAVLFLLKKKAKEDIKSPYNNGDETNTTEEASETK